MLRKFTLSLMILLLLCGVSFADFVYTTSDGTLGAIRTNQSSDVVLSSNLYTSHISSPFLTSYWNGSSTNILLLDRYGSDSGDKGYVFSSSNLEEFTASHDIPGVFGTERADFAQNGYSIYFTTGSEIYDVSTSTFTVKNSFDCAKVISQDGYDTEIYSLATDTSLIHVLARAGDELRYIRFDGQLKSNVRTFKSFDVSPGASVVMGTANSSNLAVIGHSYGIDVLTRSGTQYSLVSTDYPVKAICPDKSGGLFYAEQSQSGDVYVNTIWNYSDRSSYEVAEIESSSPNIKLIRDETVPEIFSAMTDEKITVILYSNYAAYTWEFSASSLGGTPAGITSATVSGYDPKKSGSSGCSSGYAGIIMLVMIPFVLKRK